MLIALQAQANKLPMVYFATGEQLLTACINNSVDLDRGNCWGYLSGFIEVIALTSQKDAINPTFCLTENTTLAQYQRVVIGFGSEHPEILHLGAAFLVSQALENAFPCPG